jgi:hypothetical protein
MQKDVGEVIAEEGSFELEAPPAGSEVVKFPHNIKSPSSSRHLHASRISFHL